MGKMQQLPGDEAARRLVDEPETLFFQLSEVLKMTGLDPDALKDELATGRLQAVGTPTASGYRDVCIRADHLLHWMASGTPNAIRAYDWFRSKGHRTN